MPLTKEQAEAAFDIATAPARQEHARQSALRELKIRQIMPLRWRLYAVLLGVAIGALLYWFILGQRSLWVITISMVLSVSLAQYRWNKRVKT